jgi:tetratricopeptide (TPR) repeat protein
MKSKEQIVGALAEGVRCHRAGDLAGAERIYREVLGAQPNLFQPWHLLGVIANQVGQHGAAVECFEWALALKADFAEAHCDLGTALDKLGRRDEAIASYRRAVELKPGYAEGHYNLGNALQQAGEREGAVAEYRRAAELRPDFADAHNNLGLVLKEQGQVREAIEAFSQVLRLEPNNAEAHYQLAGCRKQQGDLEGAVELYRRAMALRERYVEACTDLGVALHDLGRLEEAIACHSQCLEWNENSFAAHNNLGTVYQDQTRLEEALVHYRRAVELQPNAAEALVNLGTVYKWLGQTEESREAYERALANRPDYAAAHVGIATLKLAAGDFENGWPQFEWRWRTGQLLPREYHQAAWDGRPLEAGRTILLYCEQGYGDAIQFVRYAAAVKRGNPAANVVLECERPMLELFGSLAGVDRLVARGDELPVFDTHAALMSLPGLLGTRLETVPCEVPYLIADEAFVEQWRERLRTIGDGERPYLIGVNWRGGEGRAVAQRRDLPVPLLASLAKLPGVRLINLQKGAGERELAPGHSLPIEYLGDQVDRDHGAFMDTAAIMRNLDLVITSDTSIAHLAGALGVQVWVPLPFAAEWRWLQGRPDSPWYPTMRLFRQKAAGEWEGVFGEIRVALGERLSSNQTINR